MLFIGVYAGGACCTAGALGVCCTTGAVGAVPVGNSEDRSPPSGITPVKPIPRIKAIAVIPIAIPMPTLSAPPFRGWEGLCGLEPLGLSYPFGNAPPSAIIF
ncbi:MAG: hypothetical protein NZ878_13635 [SAR324 cluster bacterium]|nr:hypothetical protein [SAR324 cluster bacterium]